MERNESLGYLVSHFNIELQREMDLRLKRYNIDLKLWPVLFCLWEKEGITQTELSCSCDVANYTMTRMLDQLQTQQLIYRHQESDNRRSFQIFLTDEAKALEHDVISEVERVHEYFLSVINDEDKKSLLRLLKRVSRNNVI